MEIRNDSRKKDTSRGSKYQLAVKAVDGSNYTSTFVVFQIAFNLGALSPLQTRQMRLLPLGLRGCKKPRPLGEIGR